MVGIVGVIALLVVLGLSLIITRIATIALSLTGLSRDAAVFQARSAFTGTGFTTSESEKIVNHPARRRIIMLLMIARSAGLVTIVISLILSFANSGDRVRIYRLLWLIAGMAVIWFSLNSSLVTRSLNRLIEWSLCRWTDLETHDYASLLNLQGGYTVRELLLKEGDWLVGKRLSECRLTDEGVTVLGIYRGDGRYVGAPKGTTKLFRGDKIVLYGRIRTLTNLNKRRNDLRGDMEHEEAVSEQHRHEAEQEKLESEMTDANPDN